MRIPNNLLPRQTQVASTIAVDFVRPKLEIEDLYLFPITASNPAVTFRTIISNRTPQTWIPLSEACDYTGNDTKRPWNDYLDNCADDQRLNPANSTTINQSSSGIFSLPSISDRDFWPQNYSASGGTGSDTISVGGVELSGFDMNFATMTNTSFGHVGLGKDSTLLDKLVKEGHIAARAFSMFQGSDVRYTQDWDPNAKDADYPGSIVLGGYDFAKEGDAFMRGDLDASGVPQFYITGINIHSPDVHVALDDSYDAEIDISDPWIHVPRAVAESIRSLRSNTYNDAGVITSKPVHQGNITMTVKLLGTSARVGVQEFNVSFPESVWEFDRSYMATPRVSKNKYSPPFLINYSKSRSKVILGRPFLKAIYLAINYDSNEFQIAPASYSSKTEIVPFAAVSADKSDRYDSFPTRPNGSIAPTTSSGGLTQTSASDSKKDTPTAAIAGGVVGGVLGLAAIIGLIIFFLRKRKSSWVETNKISYPVTSSPGGTSQVPPLTAPEHGFFFKAELPTTEMYTPEPTEVGELSTSPTHIKGYFPEPDPEPQEVPASPVIPGTGIHVPKPQQALVSPYEPQELP